MAPMSLLMQIAVGTYFFIMTSLSVILLPLIRRELYAKTFSTDNQKVKKFLGKYESNVHFLVIARQISLFFLPFFVALVLTGIAITMQQLTSLFVLGLSINVFWAAYLSTLTKAKLYIDFGVDHQNDVKPEIIVTPDHEHIIFTRFYNLGFNTLKNTVILIYFRNGFEIFPYEDKRYKYLDFCKHFSIQKENVGVAFMPTHDNYQSIPPQEWFIFPIIVKTPKELCNQKVEIQVYSENSWGLTKYFAKVIENKN